VTAPEQPANPLIPSTSSDSSAILGRTEPRLWTPPLRELTPDTSYGFELITFARDVLDTPFDPWQEWLSIHAGELLPDGRPRFRTVLVLVSRQNGKSIWGWSLIKYWLFVDRAKLVLGTSTDRSYAKKAWSKICEEVKANPYLQRRLGPDAQRLTIGEEALTTLDKAEYYFAANNGRAARSTTLHRWLCDELREHRTRDAWNSASNAMAAVPDAQIVCISNQGDATSVLIDSLRDPAMAYIETGEGDSRIGLFEWSSPPGSEPTDVGALAMANPNFGRRLDRDALIAAGQRAAEAGGEELTGYQTEAMCMRVAALNPAINPVRWDALAVPDDEAVDLAQHRNRLTLCLDVSLDGTHATLVGAALLPDLDDDGEVTGARVHLEVIESWSGAGCLKALRADLPTIVRRVKPRVLGWFPAGPAAGVAAALAARKGPQAERWPPRGVVLEPLTAETTAVCMGLAEQVNAGEIVHPEDELLQAHLKSAQKLKRGDAWVFGRQGAGPIDASYAAAGAVHLARTLPPPKSPLTAV
jgi:hypothetical protein